VLGGSIRRRAAAARGEAQIGEVGSSVFVLRHFTVRYISEQGGAGRRERRGEAVGGRAVPERQYVRLNSTIRTISQYAALRGDRTTRYYATYYTKQTPL